MPYTSLLSNGQQSVTPLIAKMKVRIIEQLPEVMTYLSGTDVYKGPLLVRWHPDNYFCLICLDTIHAYHACNTVSTALNTVYYYYQRLREGSLCPWTQEDCLTSLLNNQGSRSVLLHSSTYQFIHISSTIAKLGKEDNLLIALL